MKWLGIAIGVTCLAGAVAQAAVPPGWSTNLVQQLERARTNDRPALVYVGATWCGPCRHMARTTLQDTNIQALLRQFLPVRVEVDEHPDFAREHGVSALPAFLVLAPEGVEVNRTVGYQDAAAFRRWLEQSLAGWRAARERRRRARAALRQADDALARGDTEALRRAAAVLFDLCAQRDGPIVEAAMDRLRQLARDRPRIVLEGVLHPRLAVRLRVGLLLRQRLGESFAIDPWDSPSVRARAVKEWAARLRPPDHGAR